MCIGYRVSVVIMTLVVIGIMGGQTEAVERPNIIVIMADDLGAGELGCYGNTKVRTPVLDELAKTGVKFETCFTPPVCHPTRFTIMTGQYGHHHGVYNFPNKRGGPDVKGEGPDKITNHLTFGQLFQKAGYETALAGKWQLSGSLPDLVFETGFDEYRIWAYAHYYTEEMAPTAKAAGILPAARRYWHPSVIESGKWFPTGVDDWGPDIYSDFLVDFMRRHKDEPFFLYYPAVQTHGPHYSTPATTRNAKDRTKNTKENFGANVEDIDRVVGKLVRSLEELELREKTVLLFTADNGTGGAGKSTATELGARVPLIVNGPGIVKSRGATGELADMTDILPTVLELAGIEIPTDRPIDGRSLAPLLRGETEEGPREWAYAFQADRRIYRTKRYLLEDNSPLHYGKLFDCGESRDGAGYVNITDSESPEAKAARAYFDKLIAKHPVPYVAFEGPPNGATTAEEQAAKDAKKRANAKKKVKKGS